MSGDVMAWATAAERELRESMIAENALERSVNTSLRCLRDGKG